MRCPVSNRYLQAVIFDLDGTLLDHDGAVVRALGLWLPTIGRRVDAALVHAWSAAEERHFPAWRAGQITFAEQRRRRLRDFLPLIGLEADDDERLDAMFGDYLRCYEAAWTAFDDVEPALALLEPIGLRLAVLTNGATAQQHAKLRAIGLEGRVGPVFTAEALGLAKPDPLSYQEVCRRLGVPPGAALHVGDRHDLDVSGARTAGLRALHLDRQELCRECGRHRLGTLAGLVDHLG